MNWRRPTALPALDNGTVRVCPQDWGEIAGSKPGTDATSRGTRWITEHLADGRALGKPVVVEEFGLRIDVGRGIPDTAAALADGAAGDQFWLLTSRVDDGSFYADHDGHRIVWNDGPADPPRTAARLFVDHARAMAGSSAG
ncbi:hypothetical protein AB0K51_31935 [Kitasatospora sp. NPDC049285]|uniref:hypothetical protein n=1 Tax=Kitasatospora sp. NPDC049285 TaxID=3157096 RepID=UPI003448DF04